MAGDATSAMNVQANASQLLTSLFGTGGSSSSTANGTSNTTFTFNPTLFANLLTASNNLGKVQGDQSLSKTAAITDSQTAMNYAIQQVLNQLLPNISSSSKTAGGYNDTTTKLLQDNASAQAAGAGANVLLNTIIQYANANQGNINAAANAETAQAAAAKGTASTNTTSSQTATSNNSTNGILSSGGGTVICTQLHKDGVISYKQWVADTVYAGKNFSPATIRGYHLWAVPFVRLMRRNKIAYAVGKFIGVHWSKYCASQVSHTITPSRIGKVFMYTLRPACWLLGQLPYTVNSSSLWTQEV